MCVARRRASFTFTGWSGDVQEQEMKNVPTTTRCTRLFTPRPVVCCTPSTSGQQAALPERVVPKTLVVSVFGSVVSTNGVGGVCTETDGRQFFSSIVGGEEVAAESSAAAAAASAAPAVTDSVRVKLFPSENCTGHGKTPTGRSPPPSRRAPPALATR